MHKNEGIAPGDTGEVWEWEFFEPNTNAADAIYLYNANGDVGQLVDITLGTSSGKILAAYEYYPYGGTWSVAGPFRTANPFRYSTKMWDAKSQCLYFNNRWLKPYWGRWLSRDPIDEPGSQLLNNVASLVNEGATISSMGADANHYTYVQNNPCNAIDPDGRNTRISVDENNCTIT